MLQYLLPVLRNGIVTAFQNKSNVSSFHPKLKITVDLIPIEQSVHAFFEVFFSLITDKIVWEACLTEILHTLFTLADFTGYQIPLEMSHWLEIEQIIMRSKNDGTNQIDNSPEIRNAKWFDFI